MEGGKCKRDLVSGDKRRSGGGSGSAEGRDAVGTVARGAWMWSMEATEWAGDAEDEDEDGDGGEDGVEEGEGEGEGEDIDGDVGVDGVGETGTRGEGFFSGSDAGAAASSCDGEFEWGKSASHKRRSDDHKRMGAGV